MKLEIGKKYVTRNGTVTSPMEEGSNIAAYAEFSAAFGDSRRSWRGDGRYSWAANDPMDLVREYVEIETPPEDEGTMLELADAVAEQRVNFPLDPKGAAGALKCPLHLVPIAPQHEVAWVFEGGARKYGQMNWRKTNVGCETYYSAMRRHLDAWFQGEDTDPESGRQHLAHLVASAFILMDAKAAGTLEDDRPQ